MTKFHFGNTDDANMLYLTEYEISDPFFYLETDGVQHIFLSALDIDAFTENGNRKLIVNPIEPLRDAAKKTSEPLRAGIAKEILNFFSTEKTVTVPVNFPLDIADALRDSGWQLEVAAHWLPERELKNDTEIAYIKENMGVTTDAFALVESILQEAEIDGEQLIYGGEILTSQFIQKKVETFLFENSCLNQAGLIVSSGKDAAKPHHQGAGPIKANQSIVVDIFPVSRTNHYFADMTRTYVKGMPSAELAKMYEAVSRAKQKVLDSLTPGQTAAHLYGISADSIKADGFDVGEKGYIHSLGHGLGLEIHEAPHLGPSSQEVLVPGHVVTIEPGLYYSEVGGVRIEDTVVVTKDGYENLTNYPENLIIK